MKRRQGCAVAQTASLLLLYVLHNLVLTRARQSIHCRNYAKGRLEFAQTVRKFDAKQVEIVSAHSRIWARVQERLVPIGINAQSSDIAHYEARIEKPLNVVVDMLPSETGPGSYKRAVACSTSTVSSRYSTRSGPFGQLCGAACGGHHPQRRSACAYSEGPEEPTDNKRAQDARPGSTAILYLVALPAFTAPTTAGGRRSRPLQG